MAVAHDATSSAVTAAGGASSLTFSHTTSGSNRLLLVTVHIDRDGGTETVSAVTYSGAACTFLGAIDNGTEWRIEFWYKIAPATGANDVVITVSSSQELIGAARSFTDARQSVAPSFASAFGTGTEFSVDIASETDGMVADAVTYQNALPTVGAGQTSRYSRSAVQSNGFSIAIYGRGSTEPGAGSVTMSWLSGVSTAWTIGAAAIRSTSTTSAASISGGGDMTAVGLAGPDYDISVWIAF